MFQSYYTTTLFLSCCFFSITFILCASSSSTSVPFPGYSPGGTDPPFLVVFITGNISVCAGCSNRYTKPAIPPNDLCIKHTEWHTFTVDGTSRLKFAPAYYHFNFPCLLAKWPSFTVYNVVVEPDILEKLNDVHHEFLCNFGVLFDNFVV